MLPAAYLVAAPDRGNRRLGLAAAGPGRRRAAAFRPGQFTMLYRPGVGEIAISVSGDPTASDGSLTQTIRDVGAVSRALT